MSLKSLLAFDFKKTVQGLIIVGWLILSFYLIYFLITSGVFGWQMFTAAFLNYLIFFHTISTAILVYILTDGKIFEIKKHAKLFIVISSILLVFAFSFIRWTTLVSTYGSYGNYVKTIPSAEDLFFFNYGGDTAFEKETILREAIALKYDIAFQQIWIFDGFMFASAFLLLMALDKKEKSDK